MLKSIFNFLYSAIAVRQYLIFSFTFFALMFFMIKVLENQLLSVNCTGFRDLNDIWNVKGFINQLNECDASSIKSIVIILWADFIFIISYSGLLSNFLGYATREFKSKYSLLIFSIPIIAGILAFLKNILEIIVISRYENADLFYVYLMGFFSIVKFMFLFISIIFVFYFILKIMINFKYIFNKK